MTVSRRDLLRSAAAVSLGFAGLHALAGAPARTRVGTRIGPLRRDPAGIIDLPEGFRYTVLSRTGDPMSDGFVVPSRPDGMAAFPAEGGLVVLVRNHENEADAADNLGPFGAGNAMLDRLDPALIRDRGRGIEPALGGCTNVLVDPASGQVRAQCLSLAGTIRNCAGGPTPWGTWLSCEEDVSRAVAGDLGQFEADHGYVFEVPGRMIDRPVRPEPLRAMGRFYHEAVAVCPRTGIVYMTEDRLDGLVYRFIPARPGELAAGGRLQALEVIDHPGLNTTNWRARTVEPGTPMRTRWIDLDDVDAPFDDLRYRGFARGAARFARGEGMWAGSEAAGAIGPATARARTASGAPSSDPRTVIYFVCTEGGRLHKGQIWRYTPSPAEGTSGEAQDPGVLELFVQPENPDTLDMGDNICVAPWGDLVVCEDGEGVDHLRLVSPRGELTTLARNALGDGEFAGSCFSPDGHTLFVNIQEPGLTLAIYGPWPSQG